MASGFLELDTGSQSNICGRITPAWRFPILSVLATTLFLIAGCTGSNYLASGQGSLPEQNETGSRIVTRVYNRVHSVQIFDGEHIQKVEVTDTLRLQSLPDGTLKFDFNLTRTNGHTCELTGVAEDKGDFFEYREQIVLDDYSANCMLRIQISDTAIRLEDDNKDCRLIYCGMRAGIDGTSFAK